MITIDEVKNLPTVKSSLPCMNEEVCPVSDADILREIREICNGLALSERARAARYDKIVEVLNERADT